MNIIDIIFLAIMIPMMIRGISKGFVSQAVLLITLLIGTYFAYLVTQMLGGDISEALKVSRKVGDVIVFAVAFIAVWAILAIIGMALKNLFKILLLEWVDKLLGGVFGLATITLVCGLAVIMFDALNDTALLVDQEYLDGSLFYHPLERIARTVFPYIHAIIPAAQAGIEDAASMIQQPLMP